MQNPIILGSRISTQSYDPGMDIGCTCLRSKFSRLLLDDHLDTAILGAAFFRLVVSHGLREPESFEAHA